MSTTDATPGVDAADEDVPEDELPDEELPEDELPDEDAAEGRAADVGGAADDDEAGDADAAADADDEAGDADDEAGDADDDEATDEDGAGEESAEPEGPRFEGQRPVPRLKRHFREELSGQLLEELELDNPMQVPALEKVVLNVGLGEATDDAKALEGAVDDLATITGQRPSVTRARRSIAGFKIRQGDPVGVKVTLRGARMYEFFDRLLTIALPRVRDFRGLPTTSFDGNGNYTFGVTEQLIFPEVDYDDIDAVRGMDITICTTTREDEHARALLRAFGFPFERPEEGT